MIFKLFFEVLALLLLAVFILGWIYLCLILIGYIRDEVKKLAKDGDGNGYN